MDFKGGRIHIKIAGKSFSARAKANIMPARATVDAGVNQDATGFAAVQPQLAEIEFSFDRGLGLTWEEDMILTRPDVTFKERDVDVTHFLTGARWVGRPTIDSATGEVTGMKMSSDRYRCVRQQ